MAELTRPFDPAGWEGCRGITVKETTGQDRSGEIVEGGFEVPADARFRFPEELRLVMNKEGRLREVPAQFHTTTFEGGHLKGRIVFQVDLAAGEEQTYLLYFGNDRAVAPSFSRNLTIRKGPLGPQHYFVENAFYRLETMPMSGQIWHLWNKSGANTSWHHYEWDGNVDRGGDPCHWAPNCWAAYPERITHGHEQKYDRPDPDAFDWLYVFGWENPQTECIDGPVFYETRRQGIVWPHPEHSSPDIQRDGKELLRAEVVYRFYADSPLIYQYSLLETLEDMNVFFIRNCQFVFLSQVFTHLIIAPERTGLLPDDEESVALLRLMGEANIKPYDWLEHTLSNILPSKLAYHSYYNDSNHDGFAQFQLTERNTNIHSGTPTYQNHATILNEVHDWSVYMGRTFSYTNRRFNPENVTYLPKGERYEEENLLMMYRHENPEDTLAMLKKADRSIKNPLRYDFDGSSPAEGKRTGD